MYDDIHHYICHFYLCRGFLSWEARLVENWDLKPSPEAHVGISTAPCTKRERERDSRVFEGLFRKISCLFFPWCPLFSIESLPAKSLALTSTFDHFRSRGSRLQKYLSGFGSLRKPKSHGWKWPLEKSNISPQGVVKSRGFGIHPPAYRFARMPVTIFGIPWLGTETFKFRGAKDSFKWNLGKPGQKTASPLNCRCVKFFQVSGEKVWKKSIHPKSPQFWTSQ